MNSDLAVIKQFAVPILLIAGMAVVAILITFRRGLVIRNRVLALSRDYDRVTQHLHLRLAAQKRDAEARQATGAERTRLLRESLELWHQVAATRDVEDEDDYEFIRQAIRMLEAELRELGEESE